MLGGPFEAPGRRAKSGSATAVPGRFRARGAWGALRGPPSRLMHEEAAVDAQRLSRHVARLARDEKADHVGDVLGSLHPAERYRTGAVAGEFFSAHAHQLALLARHSRPHVGLDESRAHAV